MSTPYPSTCPKCAKCRLYIQRRCKGLLDYQRRWCPEWITYGMVADAWGARTLTSVRCNGIKTGYWSPAKKDDLVQRLGSIEAQADRLISQLCDAACLVECCNGDEDTCRRCPLTELHGLIYGE